MFDVTEKRAVDRLAAVVVMLERREATARMANDEIRDRIRRHDTGQTVMSADERTAEWIAYMCASARWSEAQESLAAARELATDR